MYPHCTVHTYIINNALLKYLNPKYIYVEYNIEYIAKINAFNRRS